jgi:hypothetical protein
VTVRRQPIDSTVLRAVGYDAGTAELEIEFRSGDVYRYYAVPPSVFRELTEAASPGAYFNRRINGTYPTRQRYDH